MGQLNNQSDDRRASDLQAAEARLRAMTQDIENLRQNLLGQLSQDVERLQKEKSQLIDDIEKLKAQRQQQMLQQQQLVRQIAPALINQLQEIVTSSLNQLAESSRVPYSEATFGGQQEQSSQRKQIDRFPGSELSPNPIAKEHNETVDRLITALDSTLRATFKTLQQDLRSYQSSLSQQLGQMYSLEKQGEAILETLVSRLRKEAQSESSTIQNVPPSAPVVPTEQPLSDRDRFEYSDEYLDEEHLHYGTPNSDRNGSIISYSPEPPIPLVPPISEPEPPTAVPQPHPASKHGLGLALVLLSSLLLAFQNVVINVIFNKSSVFGLFELGGFATPSMGNSLLILWLRMLLLVPLMAIVATVRYPSLWLEIQQFLRSKDWSLFLRVLASGFCLFLSQVLIYLALGSLAPGVAITIYFIYPIFTVLLAWVLFGLRPSLISSLVIFSVLIGFILITVPASSTTDLSSMGVSAAVGAAIAFACHVILAQTAARNLKPVPFLWINYVIILAFSGISLAGPFPESWRIDIEPTMWSGLIISTVVLAATTLLSYLLNNIGLQMIDAARALILEAALPALTALLALVIIESTMQPPQIFGMVLVSLGIVAMSFDRLRRHAKATQAAGRKLK
jgi:drug/metabolite transporter (DMT)-like permease